MFVFGTPTESRMARNGPGSNTSATRRGRTPTAPTRGDKRRPVQLGDVSPDASGQGLEDFAVRESRAAATAAREASIKDIIAADANDTATLMKHLDAVVKGLAPDDLATLRKTLFREAQAAKDLASLKADEELSGDWRSGGYPYRNLMSRKHYERQKYRLQVELLKLQKWVKESGQRVVILFEGRDAAGKGGTIKEPLNNLF